MSPKRVGQQIAWIAIALALTGLAFGLLPMTVGSFGEDQIDTRESNDEDLSEEEKTFQEAQQKNDIIAAVLVIGPLIGIGLSVGLGLVVGVSGVGSSAERAVAVAIGAFLGVSLFVFLSAALAMYQWWATDYLHAPQWLQWDSAIKNAVLYAVPAGLLAPIATVSSSLLQS